MIPLYRALLTTILVMAITPLQSTTTLLILETHSFQPIPLIWHHLFIHRKLIRLCLGYHLWCRHSLSRAIACAEIATQKTTVSLTCSTHAPFHRSFMGIPLSLNLLKSFLSTVSGKNRISRTIGLCVCASDTIHRDSDLSFFWFRVLCIIYLYSSSESEFSAAALALSIALAMSLDASFFSAPSLLPKYWLLESRPSNVQPATHELTRI